MAEFYEYLAIGIYLALMLAIGIYSYKKNTGTSEDFLIGGRKLGPLVTALSAGAADMSGWLLMGLPGAMYAVGLSSSWLAIGLTIGAYANYVLVAPRLRVYSEVAKNSITIPLFFENRFRDRSHIIKLISSLLILIFFTLYTSSGMVAGGKLFESAFGLPYYFGLFLTALVVVAYTFLGGFFAVSLTDFVQGTIMVLALIIIPTIIIFKVGGIQESISYIKADDIKKLSLFQGMSTVGILSFLAWGLGYFGQPHILVRFMAIDRVADLKKAKNIGILWMIFSVGGAMLIGLFGFSYNQKYSLTIDDPETIFIFLSRTLFHPFIGGFLLSGILAAVMSTISSQLLVTSSSMAEDFYRSSINPKASDKRVLFVSRLSVLIVAIVAILIALHPKDSILNLVGYAWAGFGSSFGAVMIFSVLWKKTSKVAAIAGLLGGGIVVLLWMVLDHPYKDWYAMIPGFGIASLLIIVLSLIYPNKNEDIKREFEEVNRIMESNFKNAK